MTAQTGSAQPVDTKQGADTAPKRIPPNAGKGRPKGTPNKTTRELKEAILAAAERHGEDGEGTAGLEGYLYRVASTDVKAFAGLLGKVLPMQVTGANGAPLTVEIVRYADPAP